MGLSEILFYALLALVVIAIMFAIIVLAEDLIVPARVFLCIGTLIVGALIGSVAHGLIVDSHHAHADCMRQYHDEGVC